MFVVAELMVHGHLYLFLMFVDAGEWCYGGRGWRLPRILQKCYRILNVMCTRNMLSTLTEELEHFHRCTMIEDVSKHLWYHLLHEHHLHSYLPQNWIRDPDCFKWQGPRTILIAFNSSWDPEIGKEYPHRVWVCWGHGPHSKISSAVMVIRYRGCADCHYSG